MGVRVLFGKILTIAILAVSLPCSAEQENDADTAAISSQKIAVPQQNKSNPPTDQTEKPLEIIVPKSATSWSKIKDLFM